MSTLRQEAFEHLSKAREVCTHFGDYISLVNVHTTAGYLHLDNGAYDQASAEAGSAFQLAQQNRDRILTARARLLQSAIETAKCEELIDEGPDSVRHAELAEEFARDALQDAKSTQNERLLAQAYITLGLALCMGAPNKMEEMWHCSEQAGALLKPENQDYVWAELSTLRKRLTSITVADPILREWSQGVVGDKTFAEISKHFATIIIPTVWEREGRRISRTAARLSISPKKVRKILQVRGLLPERRTR
jgi:hypothetical protein